MTMMNCKDVMTKLSTDENLSFMQKMDLKFHLMMCRGCNRFKQQLNLMKEGVENIVTSEMRMQESRIKETEKKVLSLLKKDSP